MISNSIITVNFLTDCTLWHKYNLSYEDYKDKIIDELIYN